MNANLLTENGWKAVALKSRIRDNGLQRALAGYERLDEEKHAERLKAIYSIGQLTANLRRAREVAAVPAVADYLAEVAEAAETEKREVVKAQAAAAKKEGEDKKREQQEDNYQARLLAAFQKLRSSRGLSFEFIVCDGRPHCAVMVAPRITSQHKEELTKMTEGSRRFLHPGTCQFAEGKFAFSMDHPVSGLARKLQDSIQHFTEKRFPIVVGAEAAAGDDEQPAASN